MKYRATQKAALLLSILFAVSGLLIAQEKTIKKGPIQPTSPASGAEMYKAYCAVCHGPDGKGTGPAAAELKTKPADLSTLAKRHGGKFPDEYVVTVLRFGTTAAAHGTSDMPTWGPLFSVVSGQDKAQVDMRISNLIRYLKTLQEK
ncbi:MAG: c-type cytochrome [Candidatus Acidiferrales bacterium]